jgi:hypothetical protein
MTSRPEAWPWSSAAAYSGAAQPAPWLKTEFVLELFGTGDRMSAYRDFVAAGADRSTLDFYAGIGW